MQPIATDSYNYILIIVKTNLGICTTDAARDAATTILHEYKNKIT